MVLSIYMYMGCVLHWSCCIKFSKGERVFYVLPVLTNCWCWDKDYPAFSKYQFSKVSTSSFVKPFIIASSEQNIRTWSDIKYRTYCSSSLLFKPASSLYAWTPGNSMFLTIAVFRHVVVLKKQPKQLCKVRQVSKWLQT